MWNPMHPVNPTKDKRIAKGLYACSPAARRFGVGIFIGYPGAVIRLNPGSNPSETALAEYYELPLE